MDKMVDSRDIQHLLPIVKSGKRPWILWLRRLIREAVAKLQQGAKLLSIEIAGPGLQVQETGRVVPRQHL